MLNIFQNMEDAASPNPYPTFSLKLTLSCFILNSENTLYIYINNTGVSFDYITPNASLS